jgi:hypothetical protein
MRTEDRRQWGLWNRQRDDLLERTPVDAFEHDGAPVAWRGNRLDIGALEKFDETATTVVRDGFYQQALEYHTQLEGKREMWLDHARVRAAVANYLEHSVYPDWGNIEYLQLANKLRDARPFAFWGVDPFEDADRPAVQWTNRAGLVKLCPDDAREDQQRAINLYTDRLVELGEDGFEIRFAVFTMPNAAQWHLAAAIDATFKRFRNEIVYGRTDGKIARRIGDPMRRFPNLIGAWACLETPLSARYAWDRANAWNVHLNALLVFKPDPEHPKGWPDYRSIYDAWGARIHWQDVQGGSADATRAAIRELVKYPLKAVTLKTLEKASSGNTAAPALIEWPPEYFVEWWQAHKGLRRARSWGALYANGWPRPERRDPDACDWIGRIKLTVAGCDISRPLPDYMATRDRHRDLTEWRRQWAADTESMRREIESRPGVRTWRERHAEQQAELRQRRERIRAELDQQRACTTGAESARLFSIQGNKFARPQPRAGPDPPAESVESWLQGYSDAEKR